MNTEEFVGKWIGKIEKSLPKFPDDFLSGIETEVYKMPEQPVTLGSELFGQYEIVDLDGNQILQTDDYAFVKYVLYANRLKPAKVFKPILPDDISSVVKKYEARLDSFIKEIKKEIKKDLPATDFLKISNQIFNSLNLQRY